MINLLGTDKERCWPDRVDRPIDLDGSVGLTMADLYKAHEVLAAQIAQEEGPASLD